MRVGDNLDGSKMAARENPDSSLKSTFKGAGNGTRTRDPQLGKLMLYRLSYSRLYLSELYAA